MSHSKNLNKTLSSRKPGKYRYQWLWFLGLYAAGVISVGGFELISHWILGIH